MPGYECNLSDNRVGLLARMKKEHGEWIAQHCASCSNPIGVRTINGVKVGLYDEGKDDDSARAKVAAAVLAVEHVSAKFMLPPQIRVYCTSDDTSYGFVDRTSDEAQPAIGHVLLGKSVTVYRTAESDDTVAIDGKAMKIRGGMTAGGRRLVADQIYDSTVGNTEAKKAAALLTCCYHELGHVLHAYDPSSVYYDGQDLKTQLFAPRQRNIYDAARTYVSEWSLFGADVVPSEFVAEVFSGLMAGLSFNQLAIDFYSLVSGPGSAFRVTGDSPGGALVALA